MSEHDQETTIETTQIGNENTSSTESTPETGTTEATASDSLSYEGTKHNVKIDGKDEEVAYEELIKGYSHQSAASRLMNEAKELEKTSKEKTRYYEEAMSNLNYLASTNPEKVLELLGMNAEEIASKKMEERERVDAMTPEEKQISDLSGKISSLERELLHMRGSQEQMNQQQVNAHYEQRFTELGKKYPEADPQYVAFICSQNPDLSEEEVFEREHGRAIEVAEKRYMKYKDRREDSKNQTIATGGIPSPAKDHSKMSTSEAANMLMDMYGVKNKDPF